MPPLLKNILIIGGSNGLGYTLARKYAALGATVFVTGRKNPNADDITFFPLDITDDTPTLIQNLDALIGRLPKIDTLIYSAGYYQDGTIDTLADADISMMLNVSITAPALLVKRLMKPADATHKLKIMFITSSSQYTPRVAEPIYTTAKAGLGMLGASLALDEQLGKVIVVAPSGMQTTFWDSSKDVSEYLDPNWVADQIIELSGGVFKYKFAKILRGPARVEIEVEK